MFGKSIKSILLVNLLLLGFCIYIIKLYLENNINLYIHPRYSSFSVTMSAIAVLVLAIGTLIDIQKKSILKQGKTRIKILDIIVVFVLGLAFVLPAQVLSSKAIGRKPLNTPSYQAVSARKPASTPCPTVKPASIEGWVNGISQYPVHCYEGQTIELSGFVFESPENFLPNDMFYLGRVVMSCCVIDARPYALPIMTANFERFPSETWLKISGTLVVKEISGSNQLVIEPKNVDEINNPSKLYDYLNIPSMTEFQSIEPIY